MNWRVKLFTLIILTQIIPLLLLGVLVLYLGFSFDWILLALLLLLATIFAWGLKRYITKPLNDLAENISNVARGTLTLKAKEDMPGIFGSIAKSLNAIIGKLQEFVTRTQAETEVIVSEANRLRMILNSIKDGVIALDKDKRIILFNKAASTITGLRIEEVAGKHVNEVLPLTQRKQLILSDWFDESKDSDMRENVWEGVEFKSPEGPMVFDVEALYVGADLNGVRLMATFHNRTQEQQIEDMKVDFVALAAHELRTPVTIIRGYIEILEQEVGDQLDPEHREFIRRLDISASQLAGSINNILHVSNIEHGELSLNKQVANWKEIVLTACNDLNKKAQTQGKKLTVNIPDNLPKVSVDRVSITEVITNLVDNAIKYSERDKTIKIIVRKGDKSVVTEVIDEGVGIPENAMAKLFTKFYRSHRTRSSHRGTGLGLYMSRAIVEAHGGRIWVESKEGKGSTFGFELPEVDKDDPNSNNEDNSITRDVHGWIRSHSIYRS
ncbi:MAG: ATP-binding protein [Candidatus Saccharimonadales bacterium]